jgi:hypothetical protein
MGQSAADQHQIGTQPSWLRPALVPLPAAYFGWLLLILLASGALTQVVKTWFLHHYGNS